MYCTAIASWLWYMFKTAGRSRVTNAHPAGKKWALQLLLIETIAAERCKAFFPFDIHKTLALKYKKYISEN